VPNEDSDSDVSSYETSEDESLIQVDQDGVHLLEEGTERDRVMQQVGRMTGTQSSSEHQQVMQFISLKGLGVSLVNSDPKEILYLSLYELQLLVFTVSFYAK